MSIPYLIEVNNFYKTYDKVEIVLEDIFIGDKVTLIVGSNGSGKSTLFKAILGLINYNGTIKRNGTISYMPEKHVFPKGITVNEFLSGLSLIDCNNNYLDLLLEFGLELKITEKISRLSKGMQAKLNLIQCLMKESDLYILDEPFSGLDNESIEKLIKYIDKSTKCFLISSHIEGVFKELQKQVILI